MENRKQHYRHILLFYYRKGRSAVEARKKLCEVYGDNVMTPRQCQNWFAKFRSGNFEIEDARRSGRPVEADEEKIKVLIGTNPRITTREIASALNMSSSTVYDHLRRLGFSSEFDKWVTIDYQDPNAVKELTQTLLKKDFGLEVNIDEARLIPRVPLSLNYILWVDDLLKSLQVDTQPHGIDIGTGSVCIYSLLAAKRGWKMLATELDPDNFEQAEINVGQNDLNNLISVKLVSDPNSLLIGVIDSNVNYDFCMCNPPFFNFNEKPENRTSRRRQLESVSSEFPIEMRTEGGELVFVTKLIKESAQLKDKIKIYTTMVGKKADFVHLKKEVQKICPKSVAFTEFCQGRTIRWGLAWTFLDVILKSKPEVKKTKSKPFHYVLPRSKADTAFEDVRKILINLQISFEEECYDAGHIVRFKSYEDTWSHQRRKKREQARAGESTKCFENAETDEPPLPKKIKVEQEETDIVKSAIVEGLIVLKNLGGSIIFEMSCMSGDKEALHQIFQYFKNYWSKDLHTNI